MKLIIEGNIIETDLIYRITDLFMTIHGPDTHEYRGHAYYQGHK